MYIYIYIYIGFRAIIYICIYTYVYIHVFIWCIYIYIYIPLRDFQDEEGDIIVKYIADEERHLNIYGELPEGTKNNETDPAGDEDPDDDV